jgi:hypothetical protein
MAFIWDGICPLVPYEQTNMENERPWRHIEHLPSATAGAVHTSIRKAIVLTWHIVMPMLTRIPSIAFCCVRLRYAVGF